MIYPKKEDRDYLLMLMSMALCGVATNSQTMLFLLGRGSSGKLTIMKLLQSSVEYYLIELKSDTFTQGNSKIDKILNSFVFNPHVLFTWVNEPDDKRMDISLFKSIVEGTARTTELYKDGVKNIIMNCLLMLTANTYPNFKIDSGTKRRTAPYTHTSKFVDNEDEVNEAENIYLKDEQLMKKIENNNDMKNAFFKILAEYAFKYHQGVKYKLPENFKDTKECVVGSNDVMQDYIDQYLTITNNDNDRIGKEEMKVHFTLMNPKSYVTCMQLINSLKDKEIKYSGTYRHNKVKGCYYGIKFQNLDEEEDDQEPLNIIDSFNTNEPNYKKMYEKLLKQHNDKIKKYKKMVDDLL